MDKNSNVLVGINELYNNALTQFMNVQIAVNEKRLTNQQAITMLRNIANMVKLGKSTLTDVDFAERKICDDMFKELSDQMKDYLETELSPSKSL